MPFITGEFLLRSATARRLYEQFAAPQPIIDYHCHLSPRDIASNRRFANLFEIWLEGDHYKWRAMRTSGVPERYCTGDADPYDKFLAWARTVPSTLRNPLYHWTHLELARYFGIDDLLDERTAPVIWERANAALAGDDLTAHGILQKFYVEWLCTTDDPADTLEHHRAIMASPLHTTVFPCYRPDRAFGTQDPRAFNAWIDCLESTSNVAIGTFADLLQALRRRHDDFHALGCRLSDHGLARCPASWCTDREAAAVFDRVRGGAAPRGDESEAFAGYLMLYFGHLDAEKGWTKQLHLGAFRNVNSKMVAAIGPDTGFDSIDDSPQVRALATYLDRLAREDALPKVIVYNVNPADNYAFATLIGSFQDGATPGKIQLGSGWWFLDQKEGIEWQLNALSNAGLLSRFVGMVTDSRSFMSYPRHEYFRRVLCNLIGNDIDRGELPADDRMIGTLIENICHGNAASYFGLPARDTVRPDRL